MTYVKIYGPFCFMERTLTGYATKFSDSTNQQKWSWKFCSVSAGWLMLSPWYKPSM